jgi:hypothetical protein
VAIGRAAVDCLAPRCLAVKHLPAISGDGAHLAFVTPCPFMMHLAGNASTEHFLRFELVRARDATTLRVHPLITPKEINTAAVGAKDDCPEGSQPCDPHLGADNPVKKRRIAARIRQRLARRIRRVRAILRRGAFRALVPVPRAGRSKRTSPDALTFETTTKNDRLILRLRQGRDVRLTREVHHNPGSLTIDSVGAWIDREPGLVVVRVVSWAEESEDEPRATYTVGRLRPKASRSRAAGYLRGGR